MRYNTFNILSLSGGGIKGIFQSSFLKLLENEYKVSLTEIFDLIAGTSTGSILAASLAAGVKMAEVENLYIQNGREIFKKRRLRYLKGCWYLNATLRNCLKKAFKEKKISDSPTEILIPTTSLENFNHVVFTRNDDISLVDAVMASSAAPFYFESYKSGMQHFMDGGLWANDPTLLAVLYATLVLDVPIQRINVLSIGNKCMPSGDMAEHFNSIKTCNPSKIKLVIDAIFNSSESFSTNYSEKFLNEKNIITINPENFKQSQIQLDDVDKAINELPGVANELFKQNKDRIMKFLGLEGRTTYSYKRSNFISEAAILRAGLADFVPSRDDYKNSDKSNSLDKYLMTATKTIRIFGISLKDAVSYHDLIGTLEKIIKKRPDIHIYVSLLNFEANDLLKVTADMLMEKTAEELEKEVKETIKKLIYIGKKNVEVHLHSAMAFATTIVVDEDLKTGSMIVEAKPYKAASKSSFSYKLLRCGESDLFANLLDGLKKMDNGTHKITRKDIKSWQSKK